MSHEAAAELERLNIIREPAGTTRGRAQGEHTTTGLVEKHTDLSKICMLKVRAEVERQGLDCDRGHCCRSEFLRKTQPSTSAATLPI